MQELGIDEESLDWDESSDVEVASHSLATSFSPRPTTPTMNMENLFPNIHGALRHKSIQKAKRQAKRLYEGSPRHAVRSKAVEKIEHESTLRSVVSDDHTQAPHSKQGYLGLRSPIEPIGTLEDLLAKGFKYVPYQDG